ncbi:MAG: hypothetical protein ABI724_02100 [Betaproteobacteria bacterium]
MHRTARFVLICLMMVAVPLKGAVASSMVMCGPGHSGTSVEAIAGSGMDGAGNGSLHHHDHAAHSHASDAGDEHDQSAGLSDHKNLAKHGVMKCSICAACCVGGAFLPPVEFSVPASIGTESPFPAVAARFSWTVLAGLERPPRRFRV